VRRERALAEKAYDIAANQAQQKVIAEQIKIEQVNREGQIQVQALEVQRRERELESTVVKQAEAERSKIELLAEAERERSIREATGRAEAARLQGQAAAEVERLTGQAEADVVRAKGQAEAEAMQVRAEAYSHYNQAAMLDKLLTAMPEMAQALSKSLAAVDRITIVSTGDGSKGASSLTNEVARMVAQIPEIFETITGMKVGDIMDRLQSIQQAPPTAPNGHVVNTTGVVVPAEVHTEEPPESQPAADDSKPE
jgi:flotillin